MAKQDKKKDDLPFNDNDGILKAGQFQKGNQLWKNRETHGVPKALDSPEQLFEIFFEYAEDVDSKPWIKIDFKGKDADKVEIPMQKPYTWFGFENFLFAKGIIKNLDDYKKNKDDRYSDFADIITRIDRIIYDQKFTGATVGAFNSNIIARELGLADKKEVAATVVQETKIGFE